MEIRYIDAHCHVQFDPYDADRDALLARMKERGVAGVVVGVDLESSKKAVALAEAHEHLYASVGLHPNYLGAHTFDPDAFRALATHPKVVAIGECGLDFFRPSDVTDEVVRKQQETLAAHTALSSDLHKPLIIHARPRKGTQDAYRALIEQLTDAKRTYPSLRGDIHFFVGGVEEMRALTALGFTVSFTAVITFARDYDAVIREAPLAAILAETDAPYVAPLARRGERNDPLAVEDVVVKIAEIRGEDAEIVRKTLAENAKRLFAIPG